MIDGFVLAIQFLTRIPIPKQVEFNSLNIKRSILFYPIVGLIIGFFTVFPFLIVPVTEFRVSTILSLVIYFLVTGGLHFDGLADTADGLLGAHSKEDIKRIMKDSRIGAFGVIAIVLIILFKYSLYISHSAYPALIMLSIINARFAGIHLLNNYRKPGYGGLADIMSKSRIGLYEPVLLLAFAVTLSIFNVFYVLSLIASILTAKILARWSIKKIDYVSGDIIGAGIEITEVVSLIILWGIKTWI
ncbi:adenosylcobinamide-GDP ribazoletransferase [Microaceticoccus formicicus]|uniref:adenosylcobinamide-GDP ribazoletransferase n=1 Tax=Microaceticoccus formicicus TaxID=3118105 RepID=UPI003CD04FBD|nr:adenosylcobinamide-GDP ribazoletransferase [Peptoniphilaceae bacterium AMB_02]